MVVKIIFLCKFKMRENVIGIVQYVPYYYIALLSINLLDYNYFKTVLFLYLSLEKYIMSHIDILCEENKNTLHAILTHLTKKKCFI